MISPDLNVSLSYYCTTVLLQTGQDGASNRGSFCPSMDLKNLLDLNFVVFRRCCQLMVRGLKGCSPNLFLLVIFVANFIGLDKTLFEGCKKEETKLVNNGNMGPFVC